MIILRYRDDHMLRRVLPMLGLTLAGKELFGAVFDMRMPKPNNMKYITLVIGMALGTVAMSQSGTTQQKPGQQPGGVTQECILADKASWQSIGLDEAQMAKVVEVQERCKKEHPTAADAKAHPAAVAEYEKEIQVILTPEQREKWLKWCAEKSASGTLPKK